MNSLTVTKVLAEASGRTPATQHMASGDHVPISRWGKDHWTTLAYVETVAVDRGGQIQNAKMRTGFPNGDLCDSRFPHYPGDYPTRLRDGELGGHDDWDCLLDFHAEGLIEYPEVEVVDDVDHFVRVMLTERGASIAADLRRHLATGGSSARFMVPIVGQ